MRLGGFVIHGHVAPGLGACIESLHSVCDEVVTHNAHPWRGFGAARAEAVAKLGPCDYVLFLDSDEWLEPPALAALRAWKTTTPTHAFYRVVRNDWLLLDRRVLYRQEHKRRLIRRDMAVWHDAMLVHESLPKGSTADLAVEVEHAFVTSLATLGDKTRQYALLWALQQHHAGARASFKPFLRATHLLRDGVLKGAFLRGGGEALAVARSVADYHVWKYRYLQALEAGRHPELVALLASGDLSSLFAKVGEAAR